MIDDELFTGIWQPWQFTCVVWDYYFFFFSQEMSELETVKISNTSVSLKKLSSFHIFSQFLPF